MNLEGRAEGDSDEDEEMAVGGDRMIGLIFGNLEDEYLREFKDNLPGLASKLGADSLGVEFEPSQAFGTDVFNSDSLEDDYDTQVKAPDAVDYADMEDDGDDTMLEGEEEETEEVPQKKAINKSMAAAVTKIVPAAAAAKKSSQSEKDEKQKSTEVNLPVLCMEHGKPVLRFTEIFGVNNSYWSLRVKRKRPRKKPVSVEPIDDDMDGSMADDASWLKSGTPPLEGAWGMPAQVLHRSLPAVIDSDSDKSAEGGEDWEQLQRSFSRQELGKGSGQEPGRPRAEAEQPLVEDWDVHAWEVARKLQDVPEHLLHGVQQLDWEQDINWGDSSLENSAMESEKDSDQEEDKSGAAGGATHRKLADDEATRSWLGRKLLLEPLNGATARKLPDPYMRRHPQSLRIASWDINPTEKTKSVQERIQAVLKLGPGQAQALAPYPDPQLEPSEGYLWVSGEEQGSRGTSRVLCDFSDKKMVFEVSDAELAEELKRHSMALVVPPQDASVPVLDYQEYSADKYYLGKKGGKSSSKKRAGNRPTIYHSLPAQRFETMKPKLSNKDLANFHRPRASWYPHHNEVAARVQGTLDSSRKSSTIKVIVRTLAGKKVKLNLSSDDGLSILRSKCSKKFGDMKPQEKVQFLFAGKALVEGPSLAQQNVPPNAVVHIVRPQIEVLSKAHLTLPGENYPRRPPGAFKKKGELSSKDGHVILTEYSEERPLILSNIGMGARLTTYCRKVDASDPGTAAVKDEPWTGLHLALEPEEESPFLGDIGPGRFQTSLETNMFHAPAFRHAVPTTDFLLVRNAKGKLSLRRIDCLQVLGQQEPLMEVPSPAPKAIQAHLGDRLTVFVYREFLTFKKFGYLPRVRAEDVTDNFPGLNEAFIRKKLKHCAELQRGEGGTWWWVMKKSFRPKSEAELRQILVPEQVCLYESMLAAQYHLKKLGVHHLTHPGGLASAMKLLPDDAIKLAASSLIERALQLTPWSLTQNFVAAMASVQGKGGIERLEIVGPGDPTGRGLGFSFVRLPSKQHPQSGAEKAAKSMAKAQQGAVTGTDADLRRLSMEDAKDFLLKFGVAEEEIDKLTRWHRIAMVRNLSNRADSTALSKFARGQRRSTQQLQQAAREKCQGVWEKQAASLRMLEDEEMDESEGEEDLDSFAGDLENLLEAEEGKKEQREAGKGAGARRRSQEEEEREDEEAEAAELRKLLMDDDDEKGLPKKKKDGGGQEKARKDRQEPPGRQAEVEAPPASEDGKPSEGPEAPKKRIRKILKQLIKTRHEDGTVTVREVIISDPKEVAAHLARIASKQSIAAAAGETAAGAGAMKRTLSDMDQLQEQAKRAAMAFDPANKHSRGPIVCGACGLGGHMRTNRKLCPKFTGKMDPGGAEASGLIQREGTKVKIKLSGPGFGMSAPSPIPKLKLNLRAPEGDSPSASRGSDRGASSALLPDSVGHKSSPLKLESDLLGVGDSHGSKRKVEATDFAQFGRESAFPALGTAVKAAKDAPKAKLPTAKLPMAKLPKTKPPGDEKSWAAPPAQSVQQEVKEEKQTSPLLRVEKSALPRRQSRKDLTEDYCQGRAAMNASAPSPASVKAEPSPAMAEARPSDHKRKREESTVGDSLKRSQSEKYSPQRQDRPSGGHRQLDAAGSSGSGLKLKLKLKAAPDSVPEAAPAPGPALAGSDQTPAAMAEPHPARNTALMRILDQVLRSMANATTINFMFMDPVDRNDVPDYYEIVRQPMDVSKIRQRNRAGLYSSRHHFLRDVRLIAHNAHTYNDTRNTWIPPLADALLELCEKELAKKDKQLTAAESATVSRLAGGRAGQSRK